MVDNAAVFPDNVTSVEEKAFWDIPKQIHFVYGKNVQIIGEHTFSSNKNLRIARFLSLLEIKDCAF